MVPIRIDFKSALPIYEQLKEHFRMQIIAGVLEPGAQLPAIRQLAVELNINPNTVAKVYRELEQEGILENRQGKGCFVSGQSQERFQHGREQWMREEIRKLLGTAKDLGFSTEEVVKLLLEVAHE